MSLFFLLIRKNGGRHHPIDPDGSIVDLNDGSPAMPVTLKINQACHNESGEDPKWKFFLTRAGRIG
jgi:hypothetical protein